MMKKNKKNINKSTAIHDSQQSQNALVDIKNQSQRYEYPSIIEWVKNTATQITNNWFIIGLSAFAVFVSFLFYFPSIGGDQDIWFHIRYGSHFVNNMTWSINHGQFNWTEFNPDFVYVTWIGSSILYLTHALLSHYGLYILQWLVIASIIACFLFFLKKIQYSLDITTFLAILAVLLVINLKYLFIKPDMFSGLFFAVACMIYYKVKDTEDWRFLYLLPLLMLVWVNTHGGFIVGLFLISTAFGGELINALLFKKARMSNNNLKHFAICIFLSYLVLGINPEGYGYFIGIIKDFYSPGMQETKETIVEYRSMWGSITFKPEGIRFRIAGFSMLIMLLAFILICIYLLIKKRYFDLPAIFLVVFFFVFGMSIVRASQYFPLIWFFAFFYVYKRYDAVKIKGVINFISIAIIFVLCFKIVHLAITEYDSIAWFGTNWEESYPVKEVEYIKKAKLPGNIWNDYLTGGYLLWALYPEKKVFIDPRYGGYMRRFMPNAEERQDPKGLEAYSTRFPFKAAILGFHEIGFIKWLLTSDWRIIYFDKNAVVIIHKSLIGHLSKEALDEQVGAHRYAYLDNPTILKTLFNFYIVIGPDFAKEILDIYVRNVRTVYKFRDEDIKMMQESINTRIKEIQQSQPSGQSK